ncbi:MAG: family 16 glycoside hydrolase [Verrucomicrobiota bacterium]
MAIENAGARGRGKGLSAGHFVLVSGAMRKQLLWFCAALVLPAAAAERKFDFSEVREGQLPPGFRSTVTGQGKAGDWRVVLDDVAPLLPPLHAQAPRVTKQAVLAQLSQDRTDDHYPVLVYEEESFGDFTLTTRFKLVGGETEQMAGLAFRIQDEKNYYYVRASGLGGTFYFFKFLNGELIGPIGSRVTITKGAWHELSVECRGSQVTCALDGQAIIPRLLQDNFAKGKIGFWTKSDSVSFFSDTKIVYKPLEDPAQAIVRDTVKKYSRLLGLKLFVLGNDPQTTRLVASKEPGEIGHPGAKAELEVVTQGVIYYGKDKGSVSVTMPLRDRNGEVIAAAKVIMKSFPGQTEQNAIARARPIIREMQGRIQSLKDLVD